MRAGSGRTSRTPALPIMSAAVSAARTSAWSSGTGGSVRHMSRRFPEAARVGTDAMRGRLEALLDLCRKYDANPIARTTCPSPQTSGLGCLSPGRSSRRSTPDLIGKDLGLDEAYIGLATRDRRWRWRWVCWPTRTTWPRCWHQMHPPIRRPVAPGHLAGGRPGLGHRKYRMLSQAAVTSLSAHIKARVGSIVNDRELVQQLFSTDRPKAAQTRLAFQD